jgi:hypothetical protein
MSDLDSDLAEPSARQWGPWTLAGEADPDFTDHERHTHHWLLTDPQLLSCFRAHFPGRGNFDYDEMVRLLDYVWDCPHDASANVTGYCCGTCGRTRAAALTQAPDREPPVRPPA